MCGVVAVRVIRKRMNMPIDIDGDAEAEQVIT